MASQRLASRGSLSSVVRLTCALMRRPRALPSPSPTMPDLAQFPPHPYINTRDSERNRAPASTHMLVDAVMARHQACFNNVRHLSFNHNVTSQPPQTLSHQESGVWGTPQRHAKTSITTVAPLSQDTYGRLPGTQQSRISTRVLA